MLAIKSLGKKKKRPGFLKGLLNFISLIVMILLIRWAIFEIFLIPSGSMYPKLFVNDYIVVSKIDFGLRIPFTQSWVYGPKLPLRRALIVFKDPDDSKYLVKRLVGLSEDKLKVVKDFIVSVNDKRVSHKKIIGEEKLELAKIMGRKEGEFTAFREIFPGIEEKNSHIILTHPNADSPAVLLEEDFLKNIETFKVPHGHVLFMGDNRNNSYDGRRFGYVDKERFVGRARFIALSCEKKIIMNSGCNILSLRINRLGNDIAF